MVDRPGALVPPRIEGLRRERGPFESDDDLLLHAFYQPSQLVPLFRERALPERTGAAPRPADISVKTLLDEIRRQPKRGPVSIRRSGLGRRRGSIARRVARAARSGAAVRAALDRGGRRQRRGRPDGRRDSC